MKVRVYFKNKRKIKDSVGLFCVSLGEKSCHFCKRCELLPNSCTSAPAGLWNLKRAFPFLGQQQHHMQRRTVGVDECAEWHQPLGTPNTCDAHPNSHVLMWSRDKLVRTKGKDYRMEESKFPMEAGRNRNGHKLLWFPAKALLQEPACHLLLEKISLDASMPFTSRLLLPILALMWAGSVGGVIKGWTREQPCSIKAAWFSWVRKDLNSSPRLAPGQLYGLG